MTPSRWTHPASPRQPRVVDDEEEALASVAGWTMSEAAERALDAVIDAFGDRYAGAFFDDAGTLVALVKNLNPREQAEVAAQLGLDDEGIRLRLAPYSETDLERFADAIVDKDNDNLSAISIDVQRSQLVLHVGRSFSDSELAQLLGDVPADAVRVELGEIYIQW